MSFLEIASTVNIISEMNCNILKKEFSELNQSILDGTDQTKLFNRQVNLSEFFSSPLPEYPLEGGGKTIHPGASATPQRGELISKGHTSIGVQKGSTLLQALSGVKIMSNTKNGHSSVILDDLKRQRRDNIINIIKNINGGATIKDIKDKTQTNPEKFNVLLICSEKTLQRELISMVKDNVLNKTGEKRWSRYFLK
jgi:hypothetical protein